MGAYPDCAAPVRSCVCYSAWLTMRTQPDCTGIALQFAKLALRLDKLRTLTLTVQPRKSNTKNKKLIQARIATALRHGCLSSVAEFVLACSTHTHTHTHTHTWLHLFMYC